MKRCKQCGIFNALSDVDVFPGLGQNRFLQIMLSGTFPGLNIEMKCGSVCVGVRGCVCVGGGGGGGIWDVGGGWGDVSIGVTSWQCYANH